MSRITRFTAIATAGALVAAPAVLLAAPAHADVERKGACGGGSYEFSVDREGSSKYEVSADLDRVKPGSKWKVVLRQDGNRYYKQVLKADREGDLDVERLRNNTSGDDVFTFKASRVKGKASCSSSITVS
jgi:hypothetical protein